MKILIIDDSKKNRRSGKKFFETLGHEVTTLSTYTDALRLDVVFDLVILDLLMPAEGMTLGQDAQKKYLGQEIAIGFPLLLITSSFAKKIYLATDSNHHAHPMSAIVDFLNKTDHNIGECLVHIDHIGTVDDGAKDWSQIKKWLEKFSN